MYPILREQFGKKFTPFDKGSYHFDDGDRQHPWTMGFYLVLFLAFFAILLRIVYLSDDDDDDSLADAAAMQKDGSVKPLSRKRIVLINGKTGAKIESAVKTKAKAVRLSRHKSRMLNSRYRYSITGGPESSYSTPEESVRKESAMTDQLSNPSEAPMPTIEAPKPNAHLGTVGPSDAEGIREPVNDTESEVAVVEPPNNLSKSGLPGEQEKVSNPYQSVRSIFDTLRSLDESIRDIMPAPINETQAGGNFEALEIAQGTNSAEPTPDATGSDSASSERFPDLMTDVDQLHHLGSRGHADRHFKGALSLVIPENFTASSSKGKDQDVEAVGDPIPSLNQDAMADATATSPPKRPTNLKISIPKSDPPTLGQTNATSIPETSDSTQRSSGPSSTRGIRIIARNPHHSVLGSPRRRRTRTKTLQSPQWNADKEPSSPTSSLVSPKTTRKSRKSFYGHDYPGNGPPSSGFASNGHESFTKRALDRIRESEPTTSEGPVLRRVSLMNPLGRKFGIFENYSDRRASLINPGGTLGRKPSIVDNRPDLKIFPFSRSAPVTPKSVAQAERAASLPEIPTMPSISEAPLQQPPTPKNPRTPEFDYVAHGQLQPPWLRRNDVPRSIPSIPQTPPEKPATPVRPPPRSFDLRGQLLPSYDPRYDIPRSAPLDPNARRSSMNTTTAPRSDQPKRPQTSGPG